MTRVVRTAGPRKGHFAVYGGRRGLTWLLDESAVFVDDLARVFLFASTDRGTSA